MAMLAVEWINADFRTVVNWIKPEIAIFWILVAKWLNCNIIICRSTVTSYYYTQKQYLRFEQAQEETNMHNKRHTITTTNKQQHQPISKILNVGIWYIQRVMLCRRSNVEQLMRMTETKMVISMSLFHKSSLRCWKWLSIILVSSFCLSTHLTRSLSCSLAHSCSVFPRNRLNSGQISCLTHSYVCGCMCVCVYVAVMPPLV